MAEEFVDSIVTCSSSASPLDGMMICDVCSEHGTDLLARGYCVDCQEYLCETCVRHHCTPRPFKHHILEDIDDMPRGEINHRATRKLEMKACTLHPGKRITSYCKSHDQLCCEICYLIGHRVCNDVSDVNVLGETLTNKTELKAFKDKVHQTYQYLQTTRALNSNPMESVDLCYNDAMRTFQNTLDCIRSRDMGNITTLKSGLLTVYKQVEEWLAFIEDCWKNKDYGKLFILMKRAQGHVDLMKYANMYHNTPITKYYFNECPKDDANTFGTLEEITYSVEKVNVKQTDEINGCDIRDVALLGEDLMLVADYGSNCSIKLINTKTDRIVSSVELTSGPWQMALADTGQVFVTQPLSKRLLLLRSPTVELGDIKEIPVYEQCCAVECDKKRLLVQCIGPCKLLELDLNGQMKRIIPQAKALPTSFNEESYETHPYCSTMNKSTGSVYFSCFYQNAITEITRDGELRLVVCSEDLNSPFGLCLHTGGSILVCSYNGRRVLRVSMDGIIQNFLPETFCFKPSAIDFDEVSRKLYVGGNDDYVHIYQL